MINCVPNSLSLIMQKLLVITIEHTVAVTRYAIDHVGKLHILKN